ncbi:hypothetical protein [Metaclostridioides mangenotii]|uniref:Membrane protein n=1 Tax=Metaclostridioides mangenotii TaxID=1540 RepID=A0ABS4E9U3_9FIRM|nr:hypothetical protein [Clostridioides mangenotii]MBP1854678.1 putative membrane protein [Clostridioides mangenotii]
MINDIAIVIILVLVAIGTLIAVFLLGRWVECKKHSDDKELSDDVFNRCMDLDKENRYLRGRLGLDNLTNEVSNVKDKSNL